MNSPAPSSGANLPTPTVHDPDIDRQWSIAVAASNDPLVLPRVLQKLAMPEIGILAVDYQVRETDAVTTTVLQVRATAARARLVANKLRRLAFVSTVSLEASAQTRAGLRCGASIQSTAATTWISGAL